MSRLYVAEPAMSAHRRERRPPLPHAGRPRSPPSRAPSPPSSAWSRPLRPLSRGARPRRQGRAPPTWPLTAAARSCSPAAPAAGRPRAGPRHERGARQRRARRSATHARSWATRRRPRRRSPRWPARSRAASSTRWSSPPGTRCTPPRRASTWARSSPGSPTRSTSPCARTRPRADAAGGSPRAIPSRAGATPASRDGVASLVQPLIAPLYESTTAIDLLAAFLDEGDRGALQHVKAYWARAQRARPGRLRGPVGRLAPPGRDRGNRRARRGRPRGRGRGGLGRWDASPARRGRGSSSALAPSYGLFDGRFAGNAWLQELPDPITKVSWDNAAYLSEATAKRLGLETRAGGHARGRQPQRPGAGPRHARARRRRGHPLARLRPHRRVRGLEGRGRGRLPPARRGRLVRARPRR